MQKTMGKVRILFISQVVHIRNLILTIPRILESLMESTTLSFLPSSGWACLTFNDSFNHAFRSYLLHTNYLSSTIGYQWNKSRFLRESLRLKHISELFPQQRPWTENQGELEIFYRNMDGLIPSEKMLYFL